MWKDEWQAWLIARDMSWSQMFGFLYYDGHPALWYVYLKLVNSLRLMLFPTADQALVLQVAHTLIVIASFYIFIFRFRFSLLLKIFVALSYFIFFEYGIVSRGYALTILLGFLIAILLPDYRRHWKVLCALLFLICQTEVYGVFMALSFLAYIFLENHGWKNLGAAIKNKQLAGLAVITFVGVVVFTYSVYPVTNTKEFVQSFSATRPPKSESFLVSFIGIFSNTFLTGIISDPNAEGISWPGVFLSIVVIALLFYLFRRKKVLRLTLFIFILLFLVFSVVFYSGGMRQWGLVFIFFIITLQLWTNEDVMLQWNEIAMIAAFALCQFIYCIRAVVKEYKYPFSNAKQTASFLKKNVPENVPIVAINPFAATPVIGYSGRLFYELPEGETFSYFHWLEKIYLPTEAELELFANYKHSGGLIIISSEPLSAQKYPQLQLWQTLDAPNIKAENYWVYALLVKK